MEPPVRSSISAGEVNHSNLGFRAARSHDRIETAAFETIAATG